MNPLSAFNDWQSETPMNHPEIPYRAEEARDIHKCLECLGSMADIIRIRAIWKARRDFEFPDWRETYDQDFAEWIRQTA